MLVILRRAHAAILRRERSEPRSGLHARLEGWRRN